MDLNDIRSEFDAEFIEAITDDFLSRLPQPPFSDDVREELKKVRDNPTNPIILEMELAVCRVLLSDAWKLIEQYEQGKAIAEGFMDASKIQVDLQSRIVEALEQQPSRNARKAKAAQNAKLDPVRQFALKRANDGNYPSYRQAALGIKASVLDFAKTLGKCPSEQQAETTISGWLKDLGYTPSARKQGTSAR